MAKKTFDMLHTADIHWSVKPDKLAEVLRVTRFMVEEARRRQPDLVVIAGDTVDELDGAIRIDSDVARHAVEFVMDLLDIAPVAIVLGTPSHDRRTPELFGHLRGKFPIHVGTRVELVALAEGGDGVRFVPYAEGLDGMRAVLTFLPSPNKAKALLLSGDTTVKAVSLQAREMLADELRGVGTVNATVPEGVPRIVVAHGGISGAQVSTGTILAGEDLEYDLTTLALAQADYLAFGHIHKEQEFPGNVVYAGSPGRLTYGETDEKSFSMVRFEGRKPLREKVPTPVRNFAFFDFNWRDHAEPVAAFAEAYGKFLDADNIRGADVRVRVNVTQQDRHYVARDRIMEEISALGAVAAKVEIPVIPEMKVRARGISDLETIGAKMVRWAEVNGKQLPPRTLELLNTVEAATVEELVAASMAHCGIQ